MIILSTNDSLTLMSYVLWVLNKDDQIRKNSKKKKRKKKRKAGVSISKMEWVPLTDQPNPFTTRRSMHWAPATLRENYRL